MATTTVYPACTPCCAPVECDCVGTTPDPIYVTVSGGCRNGTFQMNWNGGFSQWETANEGTASNCDSLSLKLYCDGGKYSCATLAASFCGPLVTQNNLSGSCSPLYLVLTADTNAGTPCGDSTFIFTETPP